MSTPRILAFAGSARRDSYNKRLVRIAAEGARAAGADVTVLDLADYPLPLFDEDLEAEHGPPENATKLKQLCFDHDGWLLSCPEYNSSITPLLKNTIDWCSRRADGEQPLQAFRGKGVALMAASPGALGGLRGLVTVRSLLGNLGMLVLPDQLAIAKANEAFADDGTLKEEKPQAGVTGLGEKLANLLQRLHP